jgi:single-strand DNA-binding protein
MNSLNAIGNVGKDSELRYTSAGDAVCSFSFPLTAGYGDKATTMWLHCNVWGKRAETLAPMLLKGTKIGITGEISARTYKAKDGTEKSVTECRIHDVTLLGKPESKPVAYDKVEVNKVDAFDDLDEGPLPF